MSFDQVWIKEHLKRAWAERLGGKPWRPRKKRQKTRAVNQPLWRHAAGSWYTWNQTQLPVPLAGIFPSEQWECARAMWVLHRNGDAHTSEGRCPVNPTSVTTHSKNSARHTPGTPWIVVNWLPDPSLFITWKLNTSPYFILWLVGLSLCNQVPTSQMKICLMILKNNYCGIKGGRLIIPLPSPYFSGPQFPHLEHGDDASLMVSLVTIQWDTAWPLEKSQSAFWLMKMNKWMMEEVVCSALNLEFILPPPNLLLY